MKRIAVLLSLAGALAICSFSNAIAGSVNDSFINQRWVKSYQNLLNDAVAMYDDGDPISQSQTYELARAYLFGQLGLLNQQYNAGKIKASEYTILASVLDTLNACNQPGGCTFTNIAASPVNSKPLPQGSSAYVNTKDYTHKEAKNYLLAEVAKGTIPPGTVGFLTAVPDIWQLLTRLLPQYPDGKTWQDKLLNVAKKVGVSLDYASQQLTDMDAPTLAGAAPLGVRAHIIKVIITTGKAPPSSVISNAMGAFGGYEYNYDLAGWSGLVQTFLSDVWKKNRDIATLQDFQDYLVSVDILFAPADLGTNAKTRVKGISEKSLGGYFTTASIFSVF